MGILRFFFSFFSFFFKSFPNRASHNVFLVVIVAGTKFRDFGESSWRGFIFAIAIGKF